jgi:glycosyltransferase involved in cell wall biosynthesis
MRIGVFVDSYTPITTGVVHSVELARRGLEALGHEVHIVAPASRGYRDTEPRVYRFPSINLSRKVPAPLALTTSPRLIAQLTRLRFDLIHSQHPFPVGRLGVSLARRLGLPSVYTFHTQYELYAHYVPLPQSLVRRLARVVVNRHAERCDLVICPTPSSRDLLLSYGVRRPVEIVPNAINPELFAKADPGDVRARLGITGDERVLIYCGRLAREKNLPFMLHALRDLLLEDRRIRLLVLGDGAERESLIQLAGALGLGDRALFPGKIPYGDVPRYYAAGALFVMTSVSEVLPLALLEALASGLPVVSLDAPGFSDTVTPGATGLLTAHAPEAFSAAVRTLLADEPRRQAMGHRARVAAQRYTVAAAAQRLVEVYERAHTLFRERAADRGSRESAPA